jgi:hypothetical protein
MTTKSDHHLSAGSVYDLLQRLRDYIDINRRPGNDLSPKFSAEITAALATFNEPQPSAGSEPAAWSYELAHAFGTRGYSDWQKHITETKPNVPEASIRNLRPLYLNEPQPVALPIGPRELKPITMSDIRLMAGEGKLTPKDVLAAANAVLKMRLSSLLPRPQRGTE